MSFISVLKIVMYKYISFINALKCVWTYDVFIHIFWWKICVCCLVARQRQGHFQLPTPLHLQFSSNVNGMRKHIRINWIRAANEKAVKEKQQWSFNAESNNAQHIFYSLHTYAIHKQLFYFKTLWAACLDDMLWMQNTLLKLRLFFTL